MTAGALAAATLVGSGAAQAWSGYGWGYPVRGGDWRSGVVIGGFGYPYGYHGGYYGYLYPYPGPSCRRRDVWNGYAWVPAC